MRVTESLLATFLLLLPVTQCKAADEAAGLGILKRFTEEFVEVTPGNGFPARGIVLGTADPKQELPKITVEFRHSFRMSRYEVTQELYELVMGENPSRWKGPRNSVEMMTLAEAQKFCAKLTVLLRQKDLLAADHNVRLPTESEWEFCCRAGTRTRYSFGDSATSDDDEGKQASLLDPYAWHTGNAAGNDPPVGALKPNPWGLYDMHGYLSEFVTHDPILSRVLDVEQEQDRVILRSGSWKDHYSRLTSSARTLVPAATKDDAVGFRCVIAAVSSAKEKPGR